MRGNFEVDNSGYPIAAMPNPAVKGESYVIDVRTMNKLVDANNMPTALASHVAGVLNAGLRSKVYQSEWSKLNEASLDVYAKSIDPTETKQQEIPAIDSAATDSAEPTETQSVTGTVADQGSVQETPDPEVESTPAIVTENPDPEVESTPAIVTENPDPEVESTPAIVTENPDPEVESTPAIVTENPDPEVESTPAIVTENPQPAEQATALAAIIAEASAGSESVPTDGQDAGNTQQSIPAIIAEAKSEGSVVIRSVTGQAVGIFAPGIDPSPGEVQLAKNILVNTPIKPLKAPAK